MPSKPEMPPLYPPRTEEQEKRITELVERIKKDFNPIPPLFAKAIEASSDDQPTPQNPIRVWAYGFLVARKWDVDLSFKSVKRLATYRAEHGLNYRKSLPTKCAAHGYDMDDMVSQLGYPPVNEPSLIDQLCDEMYRYAPVGFHYWDRQGVPVFYGAFGRINTVRALKQFKKMTPVGKNYKDHLTDLACEGIAIGLDFCYYQNKRIMENTLTVDGTPCYMLKCTAVADMSHLSLSIINTNGLEIAKHFLRCMYLHFPDFVRTIIVVNCPSTVYFGYKIIKGALDEAITSKMQFYTTEDTPAALDALIGAERVPAYLGGKCNCPGGCIPHLDDGIFGNEEDPNADDTVHTEDIKLKAGEKMHKHFEMDAGEMAFWEFASTTDAEVRFSVFFVPKEDCPSQKDKKGNAKKLKVTELIKSEVGRSSLVMSDKLPSHTDEFYATNAGILILYWDNTASWFHDKPMQVRAYKVNAKAICLDE